MTVAGPVFGHQATIASLMTTRAQVLLLAGPLSVGKRAAAEYFLASRAVEDVMRVEKPTAELCREAIRWSGIAPPAGIKAVLIEADNGGGLTQMLNVLEDPPEWAMFLIVASRPLPPPVVSRSELHQFGLLSEADIAKVLAEQGMNPQKAAALAPYGRGRVGPAMSMDGAGQARSCVQGVLRAIISKNPDQAALALKDWDGRCMDLLNLWCAEAATGQWKVFSPTEIPGLNPGEAVTLSRSVLTELGRLGLGNPRLAAQIVLEPRSRS